MDHGPGQERGAAEPVAQGSPRHSWTAPKARASSQVIASAGKALPLSPGRRGALPEPTDPIHPTLTPSRPPVTDSRVGAVLRRLPRRLNAEARKARPVLRPDLLLELAQSSATGSAKARALSTAATLLEAERRTDEAHALREQALLADPEDLVVLRELRKHALASRDWGRAIELLERELRIPTQGSERSANAVLLTQILLSQNQNRTDAAHSARRARGMVNDENPVALLQHAAIQIAEGEAALAAATLTRAGELVAEPALQAALLLRAAQLHQALDDEAAVMPLLFRASGAVPDEVTLHLEAARVARRRGCTAEAVDALEKARECVQDAETVAALSRMQAQLMLQEGQDGSALSLLGRAESAADQYMRYRIAAGAREHHKLLLPTLRAWAQNQTGSAKVAAFCELARALQRTGQPDDARKALAHAERLAPSSDLVRLTRDALLQAEPAAEDLSKAAEAELDRRGLSAVARLSFSPDSNGECALLAQASTTSHHETLQQLQLDATLHSQQPAAAESALALWADQLTGGHQLGPLLAALDLSQEPHAVDEALAALPRGGTASTAAVVEQLHRGAKPADRATLYRTLARRASGGFAAYCHYRAARQEQDAPDVDRQAVLLDLKAAVASDSASFAAFELEYVLRARRDPVTEAALEQVLSGLSRGPREQVKHLFNAANVAVLPRSARRELLRRAVVLWPGDPLLNEALLQIAEDAPTEERVTYLLAHTDRQGEDAQRVTHLRAAAEYERGRRLTEAFSHYQHVLRRHPRDPFARAGLVRCLELKGDREALANALRELYEQETDEPRRRLLLLQQLSCQRDRADLAALQTLALLLERSSAHVPTLRALERVYSRSGNAALLREAAARLCRQLSDRRDRSTYLHLWLRLTPMDDGKKRQDLVVLDAAAWADGESPWFALALEQAARRSNDSALVARALQLQHALMDGDEDRACLALRAAEVLEPQSVAQAAAVLLAPARKAPSHPTAAEELGRLCKSHGDYETAAQAYTQAAETALSPQRRLWLQYLAAGLFQEFLGQPDRAQALLAKIVSQDAGYLDALPRLELLLRDSQQHWELAQVLGRKRGLERDPQRRAQLSLEQHRLYLRAGDEALAESALDQAMTENPDLVELLIARAELLLGRKRYREAIEVLLALSRRSQEPAQLRFALLTLGQIYLHHQPDLQRAETALTRCLQLDGGDHEALEALSELYDRDGRVEQASRVLGRLAELASEVRDIERYTLQRCELLQRSERQELAQRCLLDFLHQHPERRAAVRALISLYRSQGDEQGVRALLADLSERHRRAILAAPSRSGAYLALSECYQLSQRPTAAAAVQTLTAALGIPLRGAEVDGKSDEPAPLQLEPLTASLRTRIMPTNLSEPARDLLHHLSLLMDSTHPPPQLRRLLPAEHPAVQRLATQLEHTAAQLNLPRPELYRSDEPGLRAIHHDPPQLLVGPLDGLPETIRQRMGIRCVLMIEARLTAVTRVSRKAFIHYFHALRACIDDHYLPPPEQEVPRELTEAIRRQVGRKLRGRFLRLLNDAMGPMAVLSPEWLQTAAFQYGTRATLLLSGQLRDALWLALHDDGLQVGGDPLHAQLGDSPTAQLLLSFALSEDYLQLLPQVKVTA